MGKRRFAFASAAAQEEWDRRAYRQAVSADNWHLGDEIDDATSNAILADIGGPTRPIYQGPDGKYRFQNERTIEDAATRGHRMAHFAGKTMDQIAAASMPGEEEFVAARRATRVVPTPPAVTARPANDNTPVQAVVAPPAPTIVAENKASKAEAIAEPLPKPIKSKGAGQAFAPRIPISSPSAKIKVDKETADAVEDYLRLALNGVAGNTADEMQASVDAFLDMLKGTAEFDIAFTENLKQQQALTNAARERRGTAGAIVEMAPNFIPGVGDVSGLVADFKDYLEQGDEWGPEDWAMVAAGMIPGAPNRRTLKAGKNIADDLLDTSKVGDNLLNEARGTNLNHYLPGGGIEEYSVADALKLTGANRGLIYVAETPTGSKKSQAFEFLTSGSYSSVKLRNHTVPALRYDNPDGYNFVKFDGIEKSADGKSILLLDAKLSLPLGNPGAERDLIPRLALIRKALSQNNETEQLFEVVYEFPNEYTAAAAKAFLKTAGFDDIISVRVRK